MTEKLILATGAGSVTGFFTAGDAGRPLLGIAISSIHYDAPEAVTQAWNSMPVGGTAPTFSTGPRKSPPGSPGASRRV